MVGLFCLGNPIGPVWRGEIQTRALGLAVDVFDQDGNSVRNGAGDLVCTKPFPSMPIGFWADKDGSKYNLLILRIIQMCGAMVIGLN